jgi:hypothetical protein
MNIDGLVLVSVDDHVVEPPHMFDDRLPAKFADLAPKLVTRDDGTNAWVWDPEVLADEVRRTARAALGGREQCTVGALRERATGHDVSIRSVKANDVGRPAPHAADLVVPDLR